MQAGTDVDTPNPDGRSSGGYRLELSESVADGVRRMAHEEVDGALARLRERDPRHAPTAFSPLAMRLLRAHAWPGNVRELFSVVESAAIRSGGPRIEAQHLPAAIRDPDGDADGAQREGRYQATSEDDERAAIVAALDEAAGSRSRAAELLGMSRTTLWRRMRDFGLGDD